VTLNFSEFQKKCAQEKGFCDSWTYFIDNYDEMEKDMRRLRVDGNFWLALLLNLVFHWEGSIPAWICLLLHFLIGLSIKWFWIALGLWLLGMVLWMMLVGKFYSWAAQCGSTPDRPKENKNPYSVGAKKQDGNETK